MATGPTTEDLVEAQMELFKDCENRALRDRFKQHLLKSYETMNPPTAAKEEILESIREITKLRAEQEPIQPEKGSEDPLSGENVRKKLVEVCMNLMLPENKNKLQALNQNLEENLPDEAKPFVSKFADAQQDFLERHNLQQFKTETNE